MITWMPLPTPANSTDDNNSTPRHFCLEAGTRSRDTTLAYGHSMKLDES
jgi:hypothetical protein